MKTRRRTSTRIELHRAASLASDLIHVAARHAYLRLLQGESGAGTAGPTPERGDETAADEVGPRGATATRTRALVVRSRGAVEGSVRALRSRYPLDAAHDTERYRAWLGSRGEPVTVTPAEGPRPSPTSTMAAKTSAPPRFSVVVPVYRPPIAALRECLDSVLSQTFTDFELRVCDDAGGDDAISRLLDSYRADARVSVLTSPVNGGISAATNQALAGATGEFVVFLDHDDLLALRALERVEATLRDSPGADIVYSDSDKIGPDGSRYSPSLKPSWSPEYLLSNMYLGHLLVIRRSLVEEVGGLRASFDGSQDYDLALRCSERAGGIVHLPEILYHWRVSTGSAAANPLAKPWAYEAGRRALEDALARRSEPAAVSMSRRLPGRYRIHWPATASGVTIGIVGGGSEPQARDLLRAARALRDTCGTECEVLLAGPPLGAVADRAEGISSIEVDSECFAVAVNVLVERAAHEVVILVGGGCRPLVADWALPLASMLGREGVGVVGGRILRAGRVQHAGLVLGLGGQVGAGAVLDGLPAGRPGYLSMAAALRNVSAVSADCLATTKTRVAAAGGFDESFPLGLCEAAYCLEVARSGHRVVLEPAVELETRRSRRRPVSDESAIERFAERYAGEVAAGDRFYSPHLELEAPFCRIRLDSAVATAPAGP